MPEVHTLHVGGHELAAVTPKPPDAPGHPVILLHGINCFVRFWSADQIQALGD